MPHLPFLLLSALSGFTGWRISKRRRRRKRKEKSRNADPHHHQKPASDQ
ncbi:hypothetical protein ACNKHS_01805 [Shigella flexneri]